MHSVCTFIYLPCGCQFQKHITFFSSPFFTKGRLRSIAPLPAGWGVKLFYFIIGYLVWPFLFSSHAVIAIYVVKKEGKKGKHGGSCKNLKWELKRIWNRTCSWQGEPFVKSQVRWEALTCRARMLFSLSFLFLSHAAYLSALEGSAREAASLGKSTLATQKKTWISIFNFLKRWGS